MTHLSMYSTDLLITLHVAHQRWTICFPSFSLFSASHYSWFPFTLSFTFSLPLSTCSTAVSHSSPASSLLSILSSTFPSSHLPFDPPFIFLPSSFHFTSTDPIFSSSLVHPHSSFGHFLSICLKWPLFTPSLCHSSFLLSVPFIPSSSGHPCFTLLFLVYPHSLLHYLCLSIHLSIYPSICLCICGYLSAFNNTIWHPSILSSNSIVLSLSLLSFLPALPTLSCYLSFYIPLYLIVLFCPYFYHSTAFHLVLWFNLPSSISPPPPFFPSWFNHCTHPYPSLITPLWFPFNLPHSACSFGHSDWLSNEAEIFFLPDWNSFIHKLLIKEMGHCWQEHLIFTKSSKDCLSYIIF